MGGNHPNNIDPRPKRRKDKDNPYEIFTTCLGTAQPHYFLAFADSTGAEQCVEINKALFDAFDRFELPTHYFINAECGLKLPSIVLMEQIRTLDKHRLTKYIGRLTNEHIRGLNHALAVSIGLTKPIPGKLTRCLCGACADAFRGTGAFALRKVMPGQAEKEVCAYCKQGVGECYGVLPKVGRRNV